MLQGAIIGFGKIARNSHIPAFQSIEAMGKAKIIAAVESDEINRINCSKNYPEIKFYASAADLFENEKLDFIDICTPPLFHSEIIETAIQQNVNIICEKPFTLGLEEAKIISDKLKRSDIVFMPCHQYKYAPLWINFKEYINHFSKESKFIFECGIYRTEADFGLPVFNNPWRINKEMSGGGILTDSGIHYLYLISWMFGKPEKLTAKIFNLKHNYNVEDTAYLLLENGTGIAEITLTWAAGARTNTARLTSSCGSLIYDGKKELRKYQNNYEEVIPVPDVSDKATYNSLYISLFEEFIENIMTNNNSSEYIEDAFDSIYLLEKCYKSASEQKTIFLNE